MNKGRWAALALVGLLLAYIVAAPYLTVDQIQQAVVQKDSDALSDALADHIDFPSVRESLKEQFNLRRVEYFEHDQETKDRLFGGLAVAVAGVMVDKAVDLYVTPTGMSQALAGIDPRKHPDAPATGDFQRPALTQVSMHHQSTDRFVVTANGARGQPIEFTLRRQVLTWGLTWGLNWGLNWKVSQIKLPQEIFDQR